MSIACLGLLYNKEDGLVGQVRSNEASLNLIDLSLLPLTPIMVSVHAVHADRIIQSRYLFSTWSQYLTNICTLHLILYY